MSKYHIMCTICTSILYGVKYVAILRLVICVFHPKLYMFFMMFLFNDIYPDCRVHTEEKSYCVTDCRVLNEGKLVGSPMVVPRLMKYRLGGTSYVRAIFNFFTTGRVRSKESDSYAHDKNGLSQTAEWFVRNFWTNEIRAASPALAILHSSAA